LGAHPNKRLLGEKKIVTKENGCNTLKNKMKTAITKSNYT